MPAESPFFLADISDEEFLDLGMKQEIARELSAFESLENPDDSVSAIVGCVRSRPFNYSREISNLNKFKSKVTRFIFHPARGGHFHNMGDFNGGLPHTVTFGEWGSTVVSTGNVGGTLTERVTAQTWGGSYLVMECTGIIGYPDLTRLEPSNDYFLIGASSKHPSNHWITPNAQKKIRNIAKKYRKKTGSKLYLNDASLRFGGLFDISGDLSSPHAEHRNGRQIDIAATSTTMTNERAFLEIVNKEATSYLLEGSGSSRHYHVRF